MSNTLFEVMLHSYAIQLWIKLCTKAKMMIQLESAVTNLSDIEMYCCESGIYSNEKYIALWNPVLMTSQLVAEIIIDPTYFIDHVTRWLKEQSVDDAHINVNKLGPQVDNIAKTVIYLLFMKSTRQQAQFLMLFEVPYRHKNKCNISFFFSSFSFQ